MLKILLELLPFYFFSLMFSTESESQYYCKMYNVNRQGSEMEDHVQPIGFNKFLLQCVNDFPCHPKEVRVLVNALSVVKIFYFYTKISRLIQITKPVK